VKSLKGKRIILGAILTVAIMGLVWFGGWAVWEYFQLWDTMTNTEYENTLAVVMVLSLIVGGGLTLKKRKVPMQRERLEESKPLENQAPNSVDLEPVMKQLKENSEKLADIHSIMKFLKKVKEKEGETHD